MPTKREREYYAMGYADGVEYGVKSQASALRIERRVDPISQDTRWRKPKRKLSAWNKFVKANSRKKEFRYANGKLKLKKMGIAFRKKRRR